MCKTENQSPLLKKSRVETPQRGGEDIKLKLKLKKKKKKQWKKKKNMLPLKKKVLTHPPPVVPHDFNYTVNL